MELTSALGALNDSVTQILAEFTESEVVRRIWENDHTVWSDSPTEISDRLGWLHLLDQMEGAVSEMEMFAAGVQADGLVKAVICGMGGSSLFADFLARTFASPDGMPVTILDTTDPAAIDRILSDREITETLFVGASKSGTTIETTSQIEAYWSRLQRGPQFTAITDPGSAMIAVADRNGYRRVFQNRADIGGRFSALSYFGLLPGALAGAPIARILGSARSVVPALKADGAHNPGLLLGVAMAAAAQAGRDKLTLLIDPAVEQIGPWLEQLIAESTGKDGQGIIPIVNEPPDARAYGDDRFFVIIGNATGTEAIPSGAPVVNMSLANLTEIGAHVMIWEFATAVAGAVLGVNPFDQPNVASAKAMTADLLASGSPGIALTPVPDLLALLQSGDCLNVCAFVDPQSSVADRIERKLRQFGARHGVATMMGLGPRYLHATGQLHKGKPHRFVTIQILSDARTDVDIPDQPFSFGQLKAAQADGDYVALQSTGARVGRAVLTEFLDA